MRIYQRNRVWYIDYSFNGRRMRKRVGTSKKAADLALKEIEVKLAKGELKTEIRPKIVLFDNLCKEYLTYSEANKAPLSCRRDQVSIKNLLSCFSGKQITQISAHGLELYKNMRKSKVKAATVNRELACIKHMFTKAVHWEYLKQNPLRLVRQFKEPPGRVRYLSKEEIEHLLDCCPKHLKPIVITALNTGMRKGEILNLKWSDIDLVKRMIKVTNSKNNESRYIPINDTLFSTLTQLRSNGENDGSVFAWKNGKPIKRIDNGFYSAMKKANIKDFRFHDLRHTFASYLAMNGVDIRVIQALLGHKTIAMTMRYSHLGSETLRAAVDKLKLTGYNGLEVGTNLAQTESVEK